MAQKHDSRPFREGARWEMATISQGRLFRGRERRGTPVKERAKKAGVALPPTPDGVRDAIDSGTPETQRRARKQLQRHQKHCQQKVSRAEVAGDIEKWTRPAAKDAARKRRKKGEEKNGRPCPNLVMVPSAHRPRRTQLSSFLSARPGPRRSKFLDYPQPWRECRFLLTPAAKN